MSADPVQNRLYLQAMRPDGQDAQQPECADALKNAATDPEMLTWLQKEQAFDRAFSSCLCHCEPPKDLFATIIAGARATPKVTPWKRIIGLSLASAASLAILALTTLWVNRGSTTQQDPVTAFRSEMINTLESSWNGPEYRTTQADDARIWLASHQGVANPEIPAGLGKRETLGCKVFDWHGAKVTLICFKSCPSGNPQSASAHLFVVNAEDAPNLAAAAASAVPAFQETNAWSSANWEKDGKFYMLVSRSAMPHLQGLFAEATTLNATPKIGAPPSAP